MFDNADINPVNCRNYFNCVATNFCAAKKFPKELIAITGIAGFCFAAKAASSSITAWANRKAAPQVSQQAFENFKFYTMLALADLSVFILTSYAANEAEFGCICQTKFSLETSCAAPSQNLPLRWY